MLCYNIDMNPILEAKIPSSLISVEDTFFAPRDFSYLTEHIKRSKDVIYAHRTWRNTPYPWLRENKAASWFLYGFGEELFRGFKHTNGLYHGFFWSVTIDQNTYEAKFLVREQAQQKLDSADCDVESAFRWKIFANRSAAVKWLEDMHASILTWNHYYAHSPVMP